jgi:arylsulfatase A-like enzyme
MVNLRRLSRAVALSASMGVLGLLAVLLWEMGQTLAARPHAWRLFLDGPLPSLVVLYVVVGVVLGLLLAPFLRFRAGKSKALLLASGAIGIAVAFLLLWRVNEAYFPYILRAKRLPGDLGSIAAGAAVAFVMRRLLSRRAALVILGAILLFTGALLAPSLHFHGEPSPVRVVSKATHPNVVLVTLDTTRARNIGAYGYARARTRNLDRLAREGVRFAHAYTPVPQTAPSHATILTGLHPAHHGVLYNGWRLADTYVTLPEMLRARGYETAGAVSVVHLGRSFGFAQGMDTFFPHNQIFDRFYAFSPSTGGRFSIPAMLCTNALRRGAAVWFNTGSHSRRGDRTMDLALSWLARPHSQPFFLWVHLFDPHSPYSPPPGYVTPFRTGDAVLPKTPFSAKATRDLLDRYDGEIAFVDVQIGRLLRALESVRDQTLVVVVADHGESLGEHGWKGHNSHVTEEVIQVPLIMRFPGRIPAGRVETERVFTMDITPTVLDAAGLPIPKGLDGKSLFHPVGERPLLLQSESPNGFRLRGVLAGNLKIVHTWAASARGRSWSQGHVEIYNLARDQGETQNLNARGHVAPPAVAALTADMQRFFGASHVAQQEMSPATRAALRALGYVE